MDPGLGIWRGDWLEIFEWTPARKSGWNFGRKFWTAPWLGYSYEVLVGKREIELLGEVDVEENVKTVIVEEPLNRSKKVENGSKKVDGTTRNTDHTATVRWSDIVKNGGPGSIEDQMSSK